MLAIEVELLTGRYAATAHNDRSRAEWPPHPARFFSALVAALHDRESEDPRERGALLWLEQQPAPALDVDLSVSESVGRRAVRSVFVPVNDITLVGDAAASLRQARTALALIEARSAPNEGSKELKKALTLVQKEAAKFQKFLEAQGTTPIEASAADLERASALLPSRRTRQERTFPVVLPSQQRFAFIWPSADPSAHTDALSRLCARVTRLGHSSSLVRCELVERSVAPTLVPDSTGDYILRVVGPGQVERLELAFDRHQAVEARVLPARPQRYGPPAASAATYAESDFDHEWIVFERIGGDRVLAARGLELATAMRRALIEVHGKEDLPAALSGHEPDGARSLRPHVAFVSLPWVGHAHADGSVQGIAIVPPRSLSKADRETLMRLLARWEGERGNVADRHSVVIGTTASTGRAVTVQFRRVDMSEKASLSPARWARPSTRFATVTPIALDRHPGNLRSAVPQTAAKAAAEAESSIADACERIGLPRPIRVSLSLAPIVHATQPVRQFAPWPVTPGRVSRARVHAEIQFADPVRGPVILGAGRYYGLGLCLPLLETTRAQTSGGVP